MNASLLDVDLALGLLRLTLCVFAALLFGSSALLKLADRAVFKGVLSAYRILPQTLLDPVAALLPASELAVAVMLLIPGTRAVAAWGAAALAICFALAIAINVMRGNTSIDCGCAGKRGRQRVSAGLAWRNITLAMLLVACVPAPLVVQGVAAELIAWAAGTSLFLMYATYEALAAQSAQPTQRLSPALHRLAWSRPSRKVV